MDPNEPEIVAPEATEENVEQVAAESVEGVEAAKVEAPPEEKPEERAAKEERKRGFQERINTITRQKREAEERANAAEAQYQNLLKEIREKPLQRDQFATDGEFEAAIHERTGRVAAIEFRRAVATDASTSQSIEHRQAMEASWNEAVAEAMVKIPDWHQVVSADRGPTTQVMLEQIKESDNGPEIAYYLAKHPGEAARIAGLSAPAQIREVGKLGARLENGLPTRTSAPPPIKPVVAAVQPKADPVSDYRAWEEKRRIELFGR